MPRLWKGSPSITISTGTSAKVLDAASDTQKLARVGLQYFRPDLVANIELGKIRQPAVRRDHRPVRAEQHLVLQDGVDVAHQDRREIFRRPAGEIDVDVRFVGRDRQSLFLPG